MLKPALPAVALCKGGAFCGRSALGGASHITKTLLAATSSEARNHRTNRKKVLLAMKLTALLLTAAFLNVSAKVVSQNVTLSGINLPLEKVFTEVEHQTGYFFLYPKIVLENAKPVNIRAENMPLTEFLDIIFKNQPLKYTIGSKTINVSQSLPAVLPGNNILSHILGEDVSTPNPVKGVIRDADGEPVGGANIMIKGSKNGVSAGPDGSFSINSAEGDILIISSIGYQSIEYRVGSNDAKAIIVLAKSESKLDEIQIVAYGKTSSRLSTGNVSTITTKDIEKTPTTNVLLALQGRIPGVFIKQQKGFSGTQVEVQIQGKNSIENGNRPFYVVDGVPYSSSMISPLSGVAGGADGTPLNYLNPDDIESVSVLKDADATSIYGSRAANGAILITTKRGASGTMRFNANIQQGVGMMQNKMEVLNTQQYLQMRKQAMANDSVNLDESPWNTPAWFEPFADLTTYDANRYTDWQKLFLSNKAKYTNADLSFSGGTNNSRYLIGGNFHRETTVFPGNFSDKRGSLYFNIGSYSNDRKFHIELSGSYLKDNNQLPNFDLTALALMLPPNAPALYNEDGTLNWGYVNGTITFSNPLKYLQSHYDCKTDNLLGSALISYQLLKGLVIKSTLAYTQIGTNEWTYTMDQGYPPTSVQSPSFTRGSFHGTSNVSTWDIEPQLSYTTSFQKHQLDVLLGSSFQESDGLVQSYFLRGFNSDKVVRNIAAASSISPMESIAREYKYNAFFGRIGYNYDNKYILNLNVRRDGSSRFGSGNRFHNFASIAGAWVLSEERFIKNKFSFLSFAKLRASYGTTGNDQIGDYMHLSLYSNYTGDVPYQTGSTGLYPMGLSNPYLQWELTKKLQFGADFGFIKDRILLNLNYHVNRSSNQLLGYILPSTTGFTYITANFPATVQNTGWEITLSTANLKLKDFKWTTGLNITLPKNKLMAFEDLENSSYANSLIIGKTINLGYYFEYAGVDPATGMYVFKDNKGNLTFNPNGDQNLDRTIVLNRDPKYYGGIENTFTYKSVTLSFLFQFASQIGQDYAYGFDNPPGHKGNQPTSVLNNVWQSKGNDASIQRYSNGFYAIPSANDVNTAYMALDGSNARNKLINYWKLKNLSLSWQLPKNWIQKTHLQNARVYLLGQNLLTFTNHYIGLDPETTSLGLPPLRVITAGINISL